MAGIELLLIDETTTVGRVSGARSAGTRPITTLARALGTVMTASVAAELREAVWRANLAFVRAGLVTLSFGNASGIDRAAGILVIKPSGVRLRICGPETSWRSRSTTAG